MAELRIGTSGFQYDHWRGVLYPRRLPRHDWFARYAECFDTVEINATFYGLPEPRVFDAWRHQAPEGFLYALKFSRYGSHLRRLKQPRQSIGAFIARAARLGPHLGPILVQLPPRWRANPDRLRAFLEATPDRYRWALEFRDPDWLREDVFQILKHNRAALCIHDLVDRHPAEITARWTYLRFHGRRDGAPYSHQFLSAQARRVERWLDAGLDVFVYFNNDAHGDAVRNAQDLRRFVEASRERG